MPPQGMQTVDTSHQNNIGFPFFKNNLVSPASTPVHSNSNSKEPEVGARVLTALGIGKVLQVRSKQVKLELESWKLANDSSVICFLRINEVTVLSQCTPEKLTVAEKIVYAKLCKDLGVGAQQQGKLPGTALILHELSLGATQQLLKECDGTQRPELFISMVKGYNHAASCALQLDLYRKARDHAKNAIAVLDALENKGHKDESVVTGDPAAMVGKVKLFGECRCKSLILVARSHLENANCKQRHRDAAKSSLDQANAVIKRYSTKEFTSMPEMKPVLKQFVTHRRNVQKWKRVAKQQPPLVTDKEADTTSYSAWFANKRVWFADDRRPTQSRRTSEKATATVGWSQKTTTALAYTGFVALGAFMAHQYYVSGQRK